MTVNVTIVRCECILCDRLQHDMRYAILRWLHVKRCLLLTRCAHL